MVAVVICIENHKKLTHNRCKITLSLSQLTSYIKMVMNKHSINILDFMHTIVKKVVLKCEQNTYF